MRKKIMTTLVFMLLIPIPQHTDAADKSSEEIYEERMSLYTKMETVTQIPWYWLAGVDAYEKGLRRAQNDREEAKGVINIYYSPKEWSGPLNPKWNEEDPTAISMFNGLGLDGNGNGKASLEEDADVLYTFANYLAEFGFDDTNIKLGLWEYYKRDQAINIITGHARIYRKYGTLDLDEHAFPVPLNYNYSYQSTWGDTRGWGGRRIHEGTDIFAGYRTPARATSYGVVELKGWNKYGGWRLGIRDLTNTYHYYGHLTGYEEGLEKGDIVAPGDTIGYVGSTGYGKPGTEGKFPPHLHYGMYRDNGYSEWSFDPYPSLKSWEKAERQ